MKIMLIVVAVLFIAWTLWGYFSSRVEQAQYSVIKEADGYEIRSYPARILAQTEVKGTGDQALNDGFRIVAGYIFGGNAKKESIAMTAPVSAAKGTSEKIAMTAPVTAAQSNDSLTVSFGMPSSYSLATLPTPSDSRVQLVEAPAQKMAALTFSWYRSSARVEAMKAKLLAALKRDAVETIGAPTYAGYNAPWTPPWMIRNEVMVEIK